MRPIRIVAWMWLAVACGCGGTTVLEPTPPPPPEDPKDTTTHHTHGTATRDDAPEISRGVGHKGSVVVLWPRIIPKGDDPETAKLARAVQAALREAAEKAAPGQVDVRPEPERVCPNGSGCEGVAVGAVLSRFPGGKACTAVATVSAPGTSPARLVQWAGKVHFKMDLVPFRQPPESQIVADDNVACDKLADAVAAGEPAVTAAIQAALK